MSEKFKALSPKAKIQYIWDFYKLHIFIAVVIIGCASSWLVHLSNKTDINVYCLVFNDPENEVLRQHIVDTYSDFTNDSKAEASVDIGYIFSYDYEEKMNWPNDSSTVKYIALQASGKADTIITDYDSMLWALKQDFVYPLEDILPKDLYEKLKPYFVYMDAKDTTDMSKTHIPYGLDIADSKIYKGNSLNYDKAILCFPNVSKNPEAAINFVKYMYGIE